jgi:C-terminal processing protease CtpA/Prc
MLCLKQAFVWLLIFVFMPAVVHASFATVEEARSRATSSEPYTLDTDIELVLSKDQAVQLNISDNPHGFKECIIYWQISGQSGSSLYIFFFDDSDELIHRSGASTRLQGALKQAGTLPYLGIARWDVKNDKMDIAFCISSDKQRNRREYEQAESLRKTGKIRMAIDLRDNSKIFPAIEVTEAERLAGFVRLWSEVKYNFAFFDQVPELDWDKVLEEYLPKVEQAKTVEEYYRVLRRCIALLQDGHTSVGGPSDEPMHRPPIEIRSLQGKAVIVGITPSDKIKNLKRRQALLKADLKLGDQITHIDERPIKKILEQDIYPYIFSSTQQWRDLKAYPKLLKGEDGTEVTLRIKGLDGAVRNVTLIRGRYSRTSSIQGFSFRKPTDNIAYVKLHSFGSDEIVEQFDEVFEKIQEAKGLVIDVRKNGGGSTDIGCAIISCLTDKPLKGSHWTTRQYMPAFRAWGQQERWYEGDHDTVMPRKEGIFNGPIVVLIGPDTYSAAEDFVVVLHASGRATVVGEKTGGSTGQPLRIDLPGGASARICTKRDTYPDGRQFVGVGIIPDLEVHPTPADIAVGRDAVLEKALEVLRAKIK